MKTLILLALLILLSGCFYQTVAPEHYQAAEEYCESRGGVAGIASFTNGHISIVCKDKQAISYTDFLDSRYQLEKHNEQK